MEKETKLGSKNDVSFFHHYLRTLECDLAEKQRTPAQNSSERLKGWTALKTLCFARLRHSKQHHSGDNVVRNRFPSFDERVL
jgi:hypothetical protein